MDDKEKISFAATISESMRRQDRENRNLWIAMIVSWIVIVVLIAMLAYQESNMSAIIAEAIAKSQDSINEAVRSAMIATGR